MNVRPALLVILWCMLIFTFTASPLFTGASTERFLHSFLSAIPHIGQESPILNLLLRKMAHFSVFGVLAFFVYQALAPRRFAYIGAWGFVVMYAILDEWHQSFQPGRVPLASDVLIDTLGATLVLWLLYITTKKRNRS